MTCSTWWRWKSKVKKWISYLKKNKNRVVKMYVTHYLYLLRHWKKARPKIQHQTWVYMIHDFKNNNNKIISYYFLSLNGTFQKTQNTKKQVLKHVHFDNIYICLFYSFYIFFKTWIYILSRRLNKKVIKK